MFERFSGIVSIRKTLIALSFAFALATGLTACIAPGTNTKNDGNALPANAPPVETFTLERGKIMFWAGGCASCHAAPGASGDALLKLRGGLKLKTRFGAFSVPNISPDKATGIGNWSRKNFEDAMLNGKAPDGSHYYPSFPYTSYARMKKEDIASLWAFLKTLPPVSNQAADHRINALIKSRAAVGFWKKLYFKRGTAVRLSNPTPEVERGQYLVEGPGHCGECHTPRNLVGGFDYKNWLAGGPSEDGEGTIPNITPHEDGIGDNSIDEIVASLEPASTHIGTPPSGSNMAYIRENLARLPLSDRRAIAAYLKAIPAIASKD